MTNDLEGTGFFMLGAREPSRAYDSPIIRDAFRTTTLCGFGVRPEDALPLSKAKSDCDFCLAELAVIDEQQEKEAGHAA